MINLAGLTCHCHSTLLNNLMFECPNKAQPKMGVGPEGSASASNSAQVIKAHIRLQTLFFLSSLLCLVLLKLRNGESAGLWRGQSEALKFILFLFFYFSFLLFIFHLSFSAPLFIFIYFLFSQQPNSFSYRCYCFLFQLLLFIFVCCQYILFFHCLDFDAMLNSWESMDKNRKLWNSFFLFFLFYDLAFQRAKERSSLSFNGAPSLVQLHCDCRLLC